MKLVVLVILLLSAAHSVAGQSRINPALKRELDSIAEIDRQWRRLMFAPRFRRKPDSLANALGVTREGLGPYMVRRMQQADSTNLLRMKSIIKQYGYPGKSLVGEPTNDAAWHVIQHSDDIKPYLPLIKKAAKRGEQTHSRTASLKEKKEQLIVTFEEVRSIQQAKRVLSELGSEETVAA
jgi:hypothetical protein